MFSSSPRANKRKRNVLSINDKIEVCDMVKNKVPRNIIMDKFGIARRTISGIMSKEQDLKKFIENRNEQGCSSKKVGTLKIMREGSYKELDSALYIWFLQKREKGIPITGPVLLEKARHFYDKLYPTSQKEFQGSNGFLWRFSKRFGIKSLAISGEKLSANLVSAEAFVNNFKEMTQEYTPDMIFNADETGLYYRMLPKRTYATHHNDPVGTKKARERVTINACANQSGTIKLPLLLIGKSKKPRCFRGINQSDLLLIYKHQKNA